MNDETLFSLLFRSIPLGFASWTFIWIFSHSSRVSSKKLLDDLEVSPLTIPISRPTPTPIFQTIDSASCGLIILFGLFQFTLMCIAMIFFDRDLASTIQYIWFIAIAIIPQLLWVPMIRRNRWIRTGFAIILLYLGLMERAVILITSFHRDYSLTSDMLINFGLSLLIDLAFYSILVGIGIGITKLIEKLRLFQPK